MGRKKGMMSAVPTKQSVHVALDKDAIEALLSPSPTSRHARAVEGLTDMIRGALRTRKPAEAALDLNGASLWWVVKVQK